VPSRFEFAMAGRCRIVPEVRKIQAERVEELPVSAIVFNILPAVTAGWHRQADAVEGRRVALREIQ